MIPKTTASRNYLDKLDFKYDTIFIYIWNKNGFQWITGQLNEKIQNYSGIIQPITVHLPKGYPGLLHSMQGLMYWYGKVADIYV